MPEAYNPIVRTFCQFRAGLLSCVDVSRHEVRPGTPLETLLPVTRRREVWRQLRRQGLRLPALELSERDRGRNLLRVLRAAVSTAFYLQRWYALLLAFPLALAVYWASRRRAVHFPLGLSTVGELVIYATCFAEHKGSGYRWTRNEIALKVRLIVAESVGLPLEAIQPERTLAELGVE
jgi:hypothetical protein